MSLYQCVEDNFYGAKIKDGKFVTEMELKWAETGVSAEITVPWVEIEHDIPVETTTGLPVMVKNGSYFGLAQKLRCVRFEKYLLRLSGDDLIEWTANEFV